VVVLVVVSGGGLWTWYLAAESAGEYDKMLPMLVAIPWAVLGGPAVVTSLSAMLAERVTIALLRLETISQSGSQLRLPGRFRVTMAGCALVGLPVLVFGPPLNGTIGWYKAATLAAVIGAVTSIVTSALVEHSYRSAAVEDRAVTNGQADGAARGRPPPALPPG